MDMRLRLRVARILLQAAKTDEAVAVELTNNQWVDCHFSELTPEQKNKVWEIFSMTYGEIGRMYVNPEQMFADMNFVLLMDVDGDQLPNAFIGYKKTPFGKKSNLSGTDGSSAAKTASRKVLVDLLQEDGSYGELSHGVAKLAEYAGMRPIKDKEFVEKVLNKKLEWVDDEGHYVRNIPGLGPIQKGLYGKPLGYKAAMSAE